MISKMKRCPFCNGHNLTMFRTEIVSHISCLDCGCNGPSSVSDFGCIAAWNEGVDNPSALVRQLPIDHTRNEMKGVDL